jgi:nucleoside-diphosphate-sugar epimerase
VSDIRKATQLLAWRPQVDLREGVRRTWEYYRVHKEKYW